MIRSVSRVTTALANISLVFQLLSLFTQCEESHQQFIMILSEVGLHFVFCTAKRRSVFGLLTKRTQQEHYFPPVIVCWQVVSPKMAGV